jgi:hypothetical protein
MRVAGASEEGPFTLALTERDSKSWNTPPGHSRRADEFAGLKPLGDQRPVTEELPLAPPLVPLLHAKNGSLQADSAEARLSARQTSSRSADDSTIDSARSSLIAGMGPRPLLWRAGHLLVIIALYLGVGVFDHDLWPPTEHTVAGVTWQMARTGEIAVPRINELPYLEMFGFR